MIQAISRLPVLLKTLSRRRISFRHIPVCDVIVLFADTADFIRLYFPHQSVFVLDLDSGTRHLRPFLRCIIRGKFRVGDYIVESIKLSGARVAISAQDNFMPLLIIQSKITSCEIILIQNGLRSETRDFFSQVKQAHQQLSVDCYMAFSERVAAEVGKAVVTEALTIGSFRSNHVPKRKSTTPPHVAYISTYRTDVPHSTIVGQVGDGMAITYGYILEQRVSILRQVIDFCDRRQLQFRVLGKDLNHEKEFHFYSQAVQLAEENYQPRVDGEFQYAATDEASLVVSTSSTLGFESISRGNRTALLNPDPLTLNEPSLRFGWPDDLPLEGPFWSTSVTPERISVVLESLWTLDSDEWAEILQKYRSHLPVFNPGNTAFIARLAPYGAQTPLKIN